MVTATVCCQCRAPLHPEAWGDTCHACREAKERQDMIERGVYHLWAEREAVGEYVDRRGRKRKSYRVVAVSGAARFPVHRSWETAHNWYMTRRWDFHFVGPDGFVWWGYLITGGDNENARCRRTKERADAIVAAALRHL